MMNRILHENFDDEREEYDTGNVIDKQHCMWQLHDYYTMVLPPIQHQFIAVFFAYVALVCRFGSTNIDKNFGEQESSCNNSRKRYCNIYQTNSFYVALKYNKSSQFGTKTKKKLMVRLIRLKYRNDTDTSDGLIMI